MVGVCSGSCSGGAATSRCVAGASIQCACDNGLMGAQVCGPTGDYGACACQPIANDQPVAGGETRDLSCRAGARNVAAIVSAKVGRPQDQLEKDVVALCEDRQWPEELRACMVEARSSDELDRCDDLVPERGDHVDEKKGEEKGDEPQGPKESP